MRKTILLNLVLFLALISQAWAQNRAVSGRVTEAETGQPLPGVSVVVKGTTIGTATDGDGSYTINIPATGATLQFRFIGYASVEKVVGEASTVDVALGSDTKQLQEVIVTALGVEREEKSLGYAASTVQAAEITKARASSPMNALQGKVAGVNISTASGAPGASTKVILRGYSSIGGNNNPLYVVDGVPIDNGAGNFQAGKEGSVDRTQDFGNRANDINPDDIASISILKGASATSLYGSRAANGVILITTKKGKVGEKLSVDFTTSATVSAPAFLPQLQNTFGQGWSGEFLTNENGSWGPKLHGKEHLWGNVVDNSQQLKLFKAQESNLRDFYETGTSFLNTLAISGGTEKSSYYLSYGNATEDGIVPTDADSYKRNTLSFRGSTQGKRLSASSSINFARKDASVVTTGQGDGGGATLFQELIQIPRDISIVDFKDIHNKFNNLDNFFTGYAQNPYYVLSANGNDYEENRIYGNVSINYKLRDWLTATARGGGDISNGQLKDWIAAYTLAEDSPVLAGGGTNSPGRVNERTRFARELNADFILSSNNDLTEDLHLNGILGYNVNERYSKENFAYITNLSIPGYYNLSNSSDPATVSTTESLRRLYGAYAQAEFSYRDYLFLSLNARNDWSSTLPKNNNSFFYPGVNTSFVFSEVFPEFLPSVLSYGKLRAAWGQTGNDAEPYSISSVLIPGDIGLGFGNILFPIDGRNAYELDNKIGNGLLQPEITSEYEVGASLSFLRNRINVDVAYYNRTTTDQILEVPIAASSGYTTQVMNIGKVENKGLELLLSATPLQTNDFRWDVRYTFSNNRNKVLKLRDGLEQVLLSDNYDTDFVAIEGQPLGVFKGPGYLKDAEGHIIVNESTGFPLQTTQKEILGNAQAKYLMGLYNTFDYKGVNLSVGLDYRQGGLFYSYTQRLTQFVGNTTNTLYNDRQPFIVPNSVVGVDADGDGKIDQDENGNLITRENTTAIDMENVANYWNDSYNPPVEREHLRDRSFVKLREVVLGYSLPSALIAKTPFSSVNISLVGRNLLMWTPENNNIIDPESTTFGNDLTSEVGEFASGPTTRSFGVSLKVGF
ncbi:TonB-linked SusC/RagA family outer membrane protein [Pontibacter ummariensis]|uniref:TonB-linked outer membrane protein, SusC/RagA family n=1 Tax=Pontibacter ummariensis TaxID=1610492 RepID=A0A239IWQ2_9BACT|nr:SusC/RagA family TonB-linked outer membrane protein [Pontibacter ummariensis]PRY08997.1 TonB-linked SusC/RagA family outer membrane protein [Pontibacter ummariensis]SNS97965.1 TonB-linked outer membrane protein, SusC/RagA family [Pontibacter ummariensis]